MFIDQPQCVRLQEGLPGPSEEIELRTGLEAHPTQSRRAAIQLYLPVHTRGIGPEVFEIVELARLGTEDMQDDVAEVMQNPTRILLALDTKGARPGRAHHTIDLFRNGAHLPTAGAGGDHEIIDDGGDFSQVEDESLFPAGVFSGLGTQTGGLKALGARLGERN